MPDIAIQLLWVQPSINTGGRFVALPGFGNEDSSGIESWRYPFESFLLPTFLVHLTLAEIFFPPCSMSGNCRASRGFQGKDMRLQREGIHELSSCVSQVLLDRGKQRSLT
jgi:hypothetical protein